MCICPYPHVPGANLLLLPRACIFLFNFPGLLHFKAHRSSMSYVTYLPQFAHLYNRDNSIYHT